MESILPNEAYLSSRLKIPRWLPACAVQYRYSKDTTGVCKCRVLAQGNESVVQSIPIDLLLPVHLLRLVNDPDWSCIDERFTCKWLAHGHVIQFQIQRENQILDGNRL